MDLLVYCRDSCNNSPLVVLLFGYVYEEIGNPSVDMFYLILLFYESLGILFLIQYIDIQSLKLET